MSNALQLLRSSTVAARPAPGTLPPGVPYINMADGVMGYINAAGQPVDVARASLLTQAVLQGGSGASLTGLNGSAIATGTVADARLPSTIVRTSRDINTADGVTGGGSLGADRTLRLTGRALALHNMDSLGIVTQFASGQYTARSIVGGDGINVASGAGSVGNPTVSVDSSVVRTSRVVSAGNGLTGGGNLADDRAITLGTPGSVTSASTNSVTATSHTHALSEATIRALIADGALGEVGTYAFLRRGLAQGITAGTNYAASGLFYAGAMSSDDTQNAALEGNGSPSGTWKAMGAIGGVGSRYSCTLFMRIS